MRLSVLLSLQTVVVFAFSVTSVYAQQPYSMLDQPSSFSSQNYPIASNAYSSDPVQGSAACTCADCQRHSVNRHRRQVANTWTHRAPRSRSGGVHPVKEVQYGANLGTPSYGRITHGPWYNGDVFGSLGLLHRRIRSGSRGHSPEESYVPYPPEHYPQRHPVYQLEPSFSEPSTYDRPYSQSLPPNLGTTDAYRPMGR